MIRALIQVLEIDDFYGQTDSIDIAKGKNEIPRGLKQIKKNIKRQISNNGRQED